MSGTLKSDQRLIQPVSLPIRLRLPPIIRVTGEPKKNLVMANVLRALISVTAARARRANECHSQCLIVRLVRCVLAIGQDGRPERTGLVGKINPLMRSDFELALLFVRPFNSSNIPVVGRQIVSTA